MNFQDIPADILTIRMKRTESAGAVALQEQPVFSVEPSITRPGEFELRLSDSVVFAQPVAAADIRRLDLEITSGRAMLAQLANPAADGSIELQIAFFTGECLEMGEIEIGVDEYVEDAIATLENRKNKLKGDGLHKRLSTLCCFQQEGRDFFFLFAGPAIDGMFKNDTKQEESEQDTSSDTISPGKPGNPLVDPEIDADLYDSGTLRKPQPNRKNSYCFTGNGIRFVATETPRADGDSIYTVTKLTGRKCGPDRALRIATGKLTFADWTRAGRIRTLAKAQMDALTKEDGSYLKKWDQFGDFEGEMILKHAREVGAIQYGNMTQNPDGTVSVSILNAIDSAWNALEKGNVSDVEIVEQVPAYLANESLTFNEFTEGIEQEKEASESHMEDSGQQEENRRFSVTGFDAALKTLTLASERLPAKSGTLILSLAGHIAQIKRRIYARRSILEGRTANPQLGILIEKEGRISPTRPSGKIQPLTAFVRNKVFQKPPTLKQQEAIDVALNTPDIALIQGPPGTGKTTVIAAILERLNEIADKRGASKNGRVLLTGFQHDAVENMIDRISLNGIPVPKFGRRSGAAVSDFNAFERKLEDWCQQLASELKERNPQIGKIKRETEVRNLCLQYIQAPTAALALTLTEKIATLGGAILGEDVMRRATNLAGNLSHDGYFDDQSDCLLNAVRRLRVHAETFKDDGPERATDALDDLRDVLDEGEMALLDAASLWRREDGEPPFLDALAGLKKGLLVRLTHPPIFRVEKHNDEVIALAEEAINRIREAGFSSKDRRTAALAEFLSELECNPNGMIKAVSDYSFAFSATCQQSVNDLMQKQKGIRKVKSAEDFQKLEYEFVIVDEAARVSPLDLRIPMAQGRRIILVGDHRQLPHIVDEDVIDRLNENDLEKSLVKESSNERDERNWSNISMFEYMFVDRLPMLEKLDGITRRVTLDTQYRMHPLLGDFVSRNFYERFDKEERFGSGRPASDFSHDLPNTDGKAAIWLDVPASKGKQQRSGTSWTRSAEAAVIARHLKDWIHSEPGKNLTFGVISFYKAQAALIRKQFGGISDDDQKLRIGTVDSFQGMEFDVVILSMVRTMPGIEYINKKKSKVENDGIIWTNEMEAQASFGHLCLYNRLNVSMSRQKKLLVVVGDSSLLQSRLAGEFIPGLVDFLELCKTEGRILPCH